MLGLTSALGDEDLYGGRHGVGGLAGVVARVGRRGLLDVEPRLRLVRPVRGEHRDAAPAVVVHHALVVVPEDVPGVLSQFDHFIIRAHLETNSVNRGMLHEICLHLKSQIG